jgi:hypothetical protein
LCGTPLQDRLVNLYFQSLSVIGVRVQRSEECRGPRKITLGLVDIRLRGECIRIVRCDVEDLIKLSQRFGETSKHDIGNRLLGENVGVARVEPLGVVEVGLALVLLASPPRDIGQRFRNLAAIG